MPRRSVLVKDAISRVSGVSQYQIRNLTGAGDRPALGMSFQKPLLRIDKQFWKSDDGVPSMFTWQETRSLQKNFSFAFVPAQYELNRATHPIFLAVAGIRYYISDCPRTGQTRGEGTNKNQQTSGQPALRLLILNCFLISCFRLLICAMQFFGTTLLTDTHKPHLIVMKRACMFRSEERTKQNNAKSKNGFVL